MKLTSCGALCAAIVIAVASMAHADATLSPSKNAAYTTLSFVPVTTAYTSLAQVTLLEGKKKRVVEVDVTLIDKSNILGSVRAYATINGVEMEAVQASAQANDNCGTLYINCTDSAIFWADLDALEASSPGTFIGQPLVIDAQGLMTTAGNATVSVRARMLKK